MLDGYIHTKNLLTEKQAYEATKPSSMQLTVQTFLNYLSGLTGSNNDDAQIVRDMCANAEMPHVPHDFKNLTHG